MGAIDLLLSKDFAESATDRHRARVSGDGGVVLERQQTIRQVRELKKSGLWDKASLVLMPGSGKATKAFSIKPESGAGDFTVVRNSVKWALGKDGYYHQVPANVPAWNWDAISQKYVLSIEPQRTNLLTYPISFDNAYWQKLGVIVDDNAGVGYDCPFLNIDGTNMKKGFKLVESNANEAHRIYKSGIAATVGTYYSISIAARKGERDWIIISNSSTLNAACWFNLKDGLIGTKQSNVVTASIKQVAEGYYNCSITVLADVSSVSPSFYVAQGNGIGVSLGDGISGIYICYAPLEAGTFATSPIYYASEGSTVTRLADAISLTNSIFEVADFTMFFDLNRIRYDASGQQLFGFIFSSTAALSFYSTVTSTYRFLIIENSVLIKNWTFGDVTTPAKVVVRRNNSVYELFYGGASMGTIESSNVLFTTLRSYATIYSMLELSGFIFTPSALSDDKCIQLSTI